MPEFMKRDKHTQQYQASQNLHENLKPMLPIYRSRDKIKAGASGQKRDARHSQADRRSKKTVLKTLLMAMRSFGPKDPSTFTMRLLSNVKNFMRITEGFGSPALARSRISTSSGQGSLRALVIMAKIL